MSVSSPAFLEWSAEEVSKWIASLGYPQYHECFTFNLINGRKLIWLEASNLPQIGITDLKHIKDIAHHIRELLRIQDPFWNRSISKPLRDKRELFLEKKSQTGIHADSLQEDDDSSQ